MAPGLPAQRLMGVPLAGGHGRDLATQADLDEPSFVWWCSREGLPRFQCAQTVVNLTTARGVGLSSGGAPGQEPSVRICSTWCGAFQPERVTRPLGDRWTEGRMVRRIDGGSSRPDCSLTIRSRKPREMREAADRPSVTQGRASWVARTCGVNRVLPFSLCRAARDQGMRSAHGIKLRSVTPRVGWVPSYCQ